METPPAIADLMAACLGCACAPEGCDYHQGMIDGWLLAGAAPCSRRRRKPPPPAVGSLDELPDEGPSHSDDPWTSLSAAASVLRSKQRLRVLRALRTAGEAGLTDHEAGDVLSIRNTAAGTRRREMERLGLVERTEDTRPTVYGNPALVFRITDAGLVALAAQEASV